MPERAYTVKEIDDLRKAVETRWLFGTCRPHGHTWGRQYRAEELIVAVEQILRTHMIAGHTAQDLIDEDTPKETTGADSN